MEAKHLRDQRDVRIGVPVFTSDGGRLGYVVNRDSCQLVVGKGFLFRVHYAVELSDVERYEDGKLLVRLTRHQVHELSNQVWV